MPDFLNEHVEAPDVTWRESAPHAGRILTLAAFFLRQKEVVEDLTPVVAQEVFDYLRPDGQRGLFGMILGDAGQGVGQEEPVDVAAVFLEALVQAVEQRVVRVNTRVNGHVFVTPAFWLLTTPVGLDCVTELAAEASARPTARLDAPRGIPGAPFRGLFGWHGRQRSGEKRRGSMRLIRAPGTRRLS